MSTSRESVSSVVILFQLEVKLNDAVQEVRAKVNAIRGNLPQGIEEPIIQKLDFAAMPIVSLAVRSEVLSPRDLTTLVDKKIKRRFENISGVGKIDLVGQSKREVNVNIDPARLEALGMGVDEVIAGLQSENVNTPLGRLNRGGSESPMRISGKPDAVDQFKTMIIGRRGDRPIPLAEVARIQDGIEEQRSLALVNGIPAIGLDILKQSGANTVGVVDRVKKEIEVLQKELPPGTTIEMVRDASIMIRDSVRDVQETLILGGILTILIVFCFLNSWRSTVITGLTLPISVISSFIVMNFMGMTLNVMTLMALSLAIGLLIDDAIVVRENIVRHLERGEDHFTAAREGTSEIGLAVLATTLSVVAVFVPVAFHEGDRRAVLLPVRDHRRLCRPGLPLRLLHPGPHALLALGGPGHRTPRETALSGADPGWLQSLVRPDGGWLPRGDRLGPRSPQDRPLSGRGGLFRRAVGLLPCFKPSFSPITTRGNFS